MVDLKPARRIGAFEEMAYGMFIHFGLYAQMGQGEWIQCMRGIPLEEYMKLKDTFTASKFDARAIAKLAKESGMKYITLTSRHHDGFSLYDTEGLDDYDVMHSPVGRDLVAELLEACNEEGIKLFIYHTTLDWYRKDFNEDFESYLEYLRQSVELVCKKYKNIGGLWFDGNWSKADADWKLDELYNTIRKYQPEAMIINNTGLSARGELSHPEIDSVTFEQGLPEPIDRTGMSKYIAGEMCCTLNDHWGYAKHDYNYKSPAELIKMLCKCRKAGANFLLNIGPDGEGAVTTSTQAILQTIGEWMEIYGEAIYQGRPCNIVGEGENFGLMNKEDKGYLFVFDLPIGGSEHVTLKSGKGLVQNFTGIYQKVKSIRWMDNQLELPFEQDLEKGTLTLQATGYEYGFNRIVRVAMMEC